MSRDTQCEYKRKIGARSCNDCCRGKAISTVRHEVGLDRPVSGPPSGKFCGNGNIQKKSSLEA